MHHRFEHYIARAGALMTDLQYMAHLLAGMLEHFNQRIFILRSSRNCPATSIPSKRTTGVKWRYAAANAACRKRSPRPHAKLAPYLESPMPAQSPIAKGKCVSTTLFGYLSERHRLLSFLLDGEMRWKIDRELQTSVTSEIMSCKPPCNVTKNVAKI
jgi:hypothetical protein